MVILSMFSWWYTAGLGDQLQRVKKMFVVVNDQFSIPLLLKTLFQPFRQISNFSVDGALEDKMRAWLDRTISRLIGAFIRIIMMIVGLIALVGVVILSLLRLMIWIAMPLLPLLGVFLVTNLGIPWENLELRLPWN